MGRYPVRPTWADGHDTGIYTFERLRALTEEAAADLRRADRGGAHNLGDAGGTSRVDDQTQ